MKIIYDPDKAITNIIKHGIDFDDAKTALHDPYALTNEDMRPYDEQRFITLGMSSQAQVLIIVWTSDNDVIRIISSWKASTAQRKHYESQY